MVCKQAVRNLLEATPLRLGQHNEAKRTSKACLSYYLHSQGPMTQTWITFKYAHQQGYHDYRFRLSIRVVHALYPTIPGGIHHRVTAGYTCVRISRCDWGGSCVCWCMHARHRSARLRPSARWPASPDVCKLSAYSPKRFAIMSARISGAATHGSNVPRRFPECRANQKTEKHDLRQRIQCPGRGREFCQARTTARTVLLQ